MTLRERPRVFTIAPGAPFLATLADRLLDGGLIPGFEPKGDALALSRVTIHVPTRRAARVLRAEFAARSGTGAAILPVIKPLGEHDDDTALFEIASHAGLGDAASECERTMALAQLVRVWARGIPEQTRALFGEEPMVLPASAADAVWMARDLAALMDEAERDGGDWSKLAALASGDLAGWWQLTLGFLEIVTAHWPEHLRQNGLADPAAQRNAALRAEAQRLREQGARGPVIVAGSTGSLPATAELMAAVARLEQGAVVLPGLDQRMPDEAWDALDADRDVPSVFGHPQFGLKRLIGRIGVIRGDVIEIGRPADALKARAETISTALMPAEATHLWAKAGPVSADAFAGVSEIAAPSESMEALAIACALREAIERGQVPAALVTSNRTLARRVSAELERFGIRADDSGGTPLDQTPPAALFRLVLDVAFGPADPATILSLLKHPLAAFGQKRSAARRGAEALEILAMRGAVLPLELAEIIEHLMLASGNNAAKTRRKDVRQRFDALERELAFETALRLHEALAPLAALKAGGRTSAAQACLASVRAFEAIGREADAGLSHLYAGEAGEMLAGHLRDLCEAAPGLEFNASEWPSVWDALIAGKAVKPKFGSDPRVFIWGALEARLQHVKLAILGGLNEKNWPARPADDPFLSRSMKGGIGIEPPERRVGLAAHDFEMLMGTAEVIVSRAARAEGAPTVPSRWLQRLHAVLGTDNAKAMQARGARYLGWARQLDAGQATPRAVRPEPRPPVALRPTRFSVTDIETLRRDPYAIHAKHVLGLQPLQPLIREPDARERGTLFHAILETFVRERKQPPGRIEDLMQIGKALFADANLPAETEAVWWRRFEVTAHSFLEEEEKRAGSIARSLVEADLAETAIDGTRATLRGRADRIDVLKDGSAVIIDYKSGDRPSIREAYSLLAPQLPLEAALLARGALGGGRQEASELAYVRLKARGAVKWESVSKPARFRPEAAPMNADQLGEEAWRRLGELIAHYDRPGTGYVSRSLPKSDRDLDDDYDHLARVREWSAGSGGSE